MMSSETFAHFYGFMSFGEMLKASTSVIFDHGINYYITPTSKGWLAWIDKHPEQAIGLFDSFEHAQTLLVTAFEEMAKRPFQIRLVSESKTKQVNSTDSGYY